METFEYPHGGRITLAQHQQVILQHNDQVREQRQVVADLQATISRQAEEIEAFRSRQSRLEAMFREMYSGVVREIVLDTFRDEILHGIRVDQYVYESDDHYVEFIDPRDGVLYEQE